MSNRACPHCTQEVSAFRLLTWGTSKTYKCPHCEKSLKMNSSSQRSMIYAYLLLLVPVGLWYRTGGVMLTALSFGGILLLITFLTIIMQDISSAEA